jgi:hypothetical protein
LVVFSQKRVRAGIFPSENMAEANQAGVAENESLNEGLIYSELMISETICQCRP